MHFNNPLLVSAVISITSTNIDNFEQIALFYFKMLLMFFKANMNSFKSVGFTEII